MYLYYVYILSWINQQLITGCFSLIILSQLRTNEFFLCTVVKGYMAETFCNKLLIDSATCIYMLIYSHLLHMHALYADHASSVAFQSFNFSQKVLSMTPSLEKLIQCSRIQLMVISMNTRSQHLKGSRSKRWRSSTSSRHCHNVIWDDIKYNC